MKLIVRQYLESLKERGELDAILPDLLSSRGFIVYSRPGRGTTQYGVDVAAVGKDDDGERKVFLLTVKQGDLSRLDWDGPSAQSLRPSLNQILDVYIRTKIPKRYRNLKVVVCVCLGGYVREQVRASFDNYLAKHSTRRISFYEWNGEVIAEQILTGVLREELLPKQHRASFQKAVAMVDEPDVSYTHFARLVDQLKANATRRSSVTVARQLNICLWILFVWARGSDNLEAPYQASELAILAVWNLVRPLIGRKSRDLSAITLVLHQLIDLHFKIAGELLDKAISRVDKPHAVSMSIESHNPVDVNLKLFDLLGRIGMGGLWLHWLFSRGKRQEEASALLSRWTENGLKLIWNNPALLSPLTDSQAIDIAIFLLLIAESGEKQQEQASAWLREMVARIKYAVVVHGRYPCTFDDYEDLIKHPLEKTDAYRQEATAGSTLLPLLAAWLTAFGEQDALQRLSEVKSNELAHCTLQLWLPDGSSEEKLYEGNRDHGVSLCNLPLTPGGGELLAAISEGCDAQVGFSDLSANKTDYWPIILLACRHYRIPVPPQFWIGSLYSPGKAA